MQRNLVLVVGLAFALALAKVSGDAPAPRARDSESASEADERDADEEADDADGGDGASALGVGERLLRELRGLAPDEVAAGQPALELSILIATLPDPLASNVDWMFDSHLDALRRAFERERWVLERFHLPWSGASEVPHEPGALLFRRRDEVALVYVVGELSTGGVDPAAFALALAERCRLVAPHCAEHASLAEALATTDADADTDAKVLRLIGPVFSGTTGSLRDALERGRAHLDGVTQVRIVSGAATGPGNAKKLRSALGEVPEVTYETTLHTDATLKRVLIESVLPRLGLLPEDVAILNEGTTAYGQGERRMQRAPAPSVPASALPLLGPLQPLSDPSEMLVIPFPMSIGALRQAYERNGRAVASEVPLPGRARSANLPLDLEDRPLLAETPAATSALTPPSVDLLLEELTRTLSQHGIRAVLLFATDVRDKLFLGSELKRRLPDLQLFTTEGNVLYLWPELNRWLRGMVVLSTYPLLLRDPAWTPQSSSRQQLLFASEGAQGTFNATLRQLDSSDLVDYGSVSGAHRGRPPVWVTAVGAGTMLPLAAYDADDVKAPEGTPVATDGSLPPAGEARSERGFLGMAALCLLASSIAFVCGRAALEKRRGATFAERAHASSAPHGAEGPAQRDALARQHELYVLCHLSALCSIVLPSLPLLAYLALYGRAGVPVWAALGACGAAAALGAAVVIHRFLGLRDLRPREFPGYIDLGKCLQSPTTPQRAKWWVERVARRLLFVFGLGFVACTLWLSWRIASCAWSDSSRTDFLLLLHRAIEFDQGLSLMLPIALIGAILALWCGWHERRLRALAHAEPAEIAIDSAFDDQPAARVRRRLFRMVPDSRGALYFVPGAFVLAWLALRIGRPLDDLALAGTWASPFALLLRVGLVAPIAASAWSVLRLVSLWNAAARLLARLDPYTSTLPFADLAKEAPALRRGLMPSDVAELERRARDEWGTLLETPRGKALTAAVPALPEAAAARRDADGFVRKELADALQTLVHATRTPGALGAEEDLPVRRVVAVEILLYTEWVLQHLRRLATFLVLAMVLTTALVWSYSFQPQNLVQTVSLVVFAAAIVVLLWLIVALDRDRALGRIAGGGGGELGWDRSFVTSLVLFGLAPVVTMLTSNAPELRKALSEILDPVLRALTTG